MPKLIEVTGYYWECEDCGASSKYHEKDTTTLNVFTAKEDAMVSMIDHESDCTGNTENGYCQTCIHFNSVSDAQYIADNMFRNFLPRICPIHNKLCYSTDKCDNWKK